MKQRPPVVTVMGHIDHGKTSLLDKIRQSQLTNQEHGGITQHIGAYQIEHQGKKITFIDTPGHVAFSQMRARGAQVTDLVVLVIAADDGVMPQTKESLEHIRAAKVPFLIAINKMDLAAANPKKIKEQLKKEGVLVEGYGGETVCVEVSAKTGKGVNDLLEMILLLAEMETLKADPDGPFTGVIIESSLDRQRGPLATILVKNGRLRVGDEIQSGKLGAKVRAMFDENGQRIKVAGPSQPVEILGFKVVPRVGSVVKNNQRKLLPVVEQSTTKFELTPEEKEAGLKIILKSDTQGTLEAVLGSLPDEAVVVAKSVGDVNESDVFLAATTESEIIGFNVKVSPQIKKLSQNEKVKITTFEVIYELLEALEAALKPEEKEEEILGEAEIIAEFQIDQERVAGCRVKKGKISQDDQLRLKRGEKVIGITKIKSMKHKKEAITEARTGKEFGVLFNPPLDFKIGDVIIAYRVKNGAKT